jgi:ubiquinone/menaquinone biosynthesis C-methylase UbiE
MLAVARKRCGDAENVSFVRTSGRDLAAIADAAFHTIVAADTFPYLVQLGLAAAARHIDEAARVLRPKGMLAILNFSYREDRARDLHDIANLANRAGLDVVEAGERPFSLWDGMAFLLWKR